MPGVAVLWAMVAEVARWDAYKFIGRRLLPDAYGYPVSRIVQLKGDVLRLPRLPFAFYVPSFWGLATLTKLNTEMHICCTNFFYVLSNEILRFLSETETDNTDESLGLVSQDLNS